MKFRTIALIGAIMISLLAFSNSSNASEDQINLKSNLVNWMMDDANQVTYALTSEGKLHKIKHDSIAISKTTTVGTNPADLYLFNNKIYVSLPNTNSIKVIDTTTMETTNTITTKLEPYHIAVNSTQLFYSDNHEIYEKSLDDGTETDVVIQGDTWTPFSEPDLYLDQETNVLYAAEHGSSGSSLKAFSTEDYSLFSRTTYGESYGFPFPKGNFTVDGNDVFYAGHKINKNDLAEIHGFYTNEYSQNNLTGSGLANIIGADDNYVYTQKNVFNRDTFRKVGTMPSNITHVLSDGQLRLMYDSQNKTIFNNQDSYADQAAQTQFNNNKLSLNQPIDKWIFDEPNQKIYAISTSENQLLVINAGTMEVIERRFVGSAPTDIELLNNKLYIALAGSTKIATTSTAQGSAVNYITTLQNPYDLTTDGTKINYATLDQHVTLYHIDLQTNTEQALEFYDTNKNTYYEPAIHLDSSNNYLYVGESGSTGSDLLVLNPETGEHISVYEFSFSLPERAILMESNDLYYAGHRFDKTNITNSKVQLFENRDKLIAISDSYIFSDRKIYNKETNQPIFEYPSDMTVNSAAADSSGNIYLSTSENNAIYKFKSLDELQNRIVKNLAFTQHDDGSYEFTWDQVTGDGYKIYAKHEELDKFTSITDAPVIAQNLKVTDAQLKQWLGRDVSFGVKAQFGNEESVSMNTIQHTFEVPTPVITDYGLKETPENLSEYGEEAFLLRFEQEKLMDGFNVYAYSEDQEVNQKFEVEELTQPEMWFAEETYNKWAGKTMNFEITYVVNGHESKKSETVSHTFEEIEEDPEEGPINLKVPKITYLGFEATPEELKDYGDMFFVLRLNLDEQAEGYKIYAYSEDGEVEYSHTSHYRVSRISFLEKLYNRWDGKLMHFQVSQIIDGVESEKSKVSTFNFGKEVDSEDDTNDNSSDSGQDETTKNSDDSGTTEEDDTNQTDGRTSNNNNSETDDDETNQTPEIVTVKVSKVNDTHIVTDEAFENVGSGDEINIDLKDDEEADSSVSLTKEQIEYLKENGNKISVERVTTRITIPSSIFEGNENDTVVHINRLENVFDALSDVYDYTISQGDSTISEFSEPVTLSFTVDPEKVQNPDNVKVYYYNEEREEWELIGGTYEDGVVTAETNHFSTYAVFEKEDPSDEETTSDSSEEDSPEENEVAASEPDQPNNNSSSSVIWWIVFGLVIVGAAFIVVRKKLRN